MNKSLGYKDFLFAYSLLLTLYACKTKPVYMDYNDYPAPLNAELGMLYSPDGTTVNVWAPTADELKLRIYVAGLEGEAIEEYDMRVDEHGVWSSKLSGDYHGKYYTIQASVNGQWLSEVAEPYARAVGANGQRAMIIDLKKTDPQGWQEDQRPPLASANDIIIYELQVRDISIDETSGITHRGKFLGLSESGTTGMDGVLTGLDHIADLGVTHVHILPAFDFRSIDETNLEVGKYNWGYDPQNYNVPEGSYATDPTDGAVRIREFKTMIKALHENGIRVILDVVYNHTGATEDSNFNQLVPGYYYRQNEEGGWSDAAACGNETASERAMMRKFILESVTYWAEEYHLDGFRFDLMGIHDIETMNQVAQRLKAIDPSIFIYGEGWTAGGSPLPDSVRALKANTTQLDGIAVFSDELRDAIKGHWYEENDQGFVSGKEGREESIKFGIVAATNHAGVDFENVNYSKVPWSPAPTQTINYVSCHDNHTLWDKLVLTNPDADEEELIRMHKLAETIVFTSQGVSFMHAGADFLRTKQGVENSYKSPDSINLMDWSRKAEYIEVHQYYKDLIRLRKNHRAFRMPTTEMINQHLSFLDFEENNLVGFQIEGNANGDSWSDILVIHNGNKEAMSLNIPVGEWSVVLEDHLLDEEGLRRTKDNTVSVAP
ncbi:MAG: type I pullulanase, partial [Bacteroidota bacterium]